MLKQVQHDAQIINNPSGTCNHERSTELTSNVLFQGLKTPQSKNILHITNNLVGKLIY